MVGEVGSVGEVEAVGEDRTDTPSAHCGVMTSAVRLPKCLWALSMSRSIAPRTFGPPNNRGCGVTPAPKLARSVGPSADCGVTPVALPTRLDDELTDNGVKAGAGV